MKLHELALASQMLGEYSDALSNDGCNDWSFPPEWTVEQKVEFVREYHEFNGDPENFDPSFLWLPNTGVTALLAHKLKLPLT